MNDEARLEARYRRMFGWRAGYLPRDRGALDAWHRELKAQLREEGAGRERNPAVRALEELLAADPIVRMYVSEMIAQVPVGHKNHIKHTDELLEALDRITVTAPLYNADPNKRNAFPMSSLFAYMMMTTAGEAVFRNEAFNEAIRGILQEWCRYLDGPGSAHVLNEGEYGWLSQFAYQDMKLYEFVFDRAAPHWGWTSYNDFFHREIRKEARPIAAPGDPKVIVSANDGNLVTIARGVQRTDTFWLKGEPFSLADMLDRSEYVDRFVGGYVFQSFLSGANYHRWHAPIDGVVRDARIVNGLLFSEAESAGFDPNAGILSEGYDACVNTRGLVFIESPDPSIGMVCVMPIGITEISSVTITVKAGDQVAKGDQLGYFSYGGSSMCLVFQPGAIDHFTGPTPPPLPVVDPTSGPAVQVNAQIAVAN
jgi:phosphatidylserine decarboxylase